MRSKGQNQTIPNYYVIKYILLLLSLLLSQLSYETIVYAYARTVLIHQCLNRKYKLSTEIF